MEKQKNLSCLLKTLRKPTNKEKSQYLQGFALLEGNQRVNEKEVYLLVDINK